MAIKLPLDPKGVSDVILIAFVPEMQNKMLLIIVLEYHPN